VRGCDLAAALEEFRDSNIRPVAYGADYPDLESFLIDLAADNVPSPSQNVHNYVAPARSTPKHGWLDLAGPAEEALQGTLDLARRALQAIGQVERRSALPRGLDSWSYADRLFIHERTAASVIGPIERLQSETAALAMAGTFRSLTRLHMRPYHLAMSAAANHARQLETAPERRQCARSYRGSPSLSVMPSADADRQRGAA
jgi:hypothetical protein